ncbi:alkaline phosphatase family protein [Lacisediminihabitans sp.]|uniref:alkaline phosphatase family protein n=1 Tax=Lacisediminihabitans sp. TaxID=2787631 RepID=UPI00374DE1FE
MVGEHDDPAAVTPEDSRPSRRSFLRATGIAAASGLVVGGVAGGVIGARIPAPGNDQEFEPLPARAEPGFDHLVVIMFENRSFDNLLGWLYGDGDLAPGQRFAGLAGAAHTNTAPDGTVVEAHVYTGGTDHVMGQPNPDPGEFYPHVNTQLFDSVDPPSNADLATNGVSAPFNAPRDASNPTMSGFVRDYIVNFRAETGREPTPDEYRVAMGGFSPEMLPVFSTLAREFVVYDSWFAAVPSQTFCNRSFFHASTSHGFVTNREGDGIGKWLAAPPAPTVFNRLEEAGVSWRVYYDEDQLVSLTGMLHATVLEKYWKTHFRGMAQFHADAKNGTLPAYAFIEPRMIFNHNDMHPPVGRLRGSEVDGQPVYDSALSDVRAGEVLLSQVYTSIRNGRSVPGSNAINTTLVVTFDEHGGTFDHVPPPRAVAPLAGDPPGEMGFAFDRLGCRVPTIVVSAYTRAGTIVNAETHHGAVISTLVRLHGLDPLTRRDDTAADIFTAITLGTPRQPALWPQTVPAYVPANPEAGLAPHLEHRLRPLSPPASGLLGLLLARYEPGAPVPATYGDAYDVLVKHGKGLFGIAD